MFNILFYRSKCIGCNGCVEAAPYRWRMSKKDGKSNLLKSSEKKGIFRIQLTEDELDDNIKAAKNCPVNIIQIIE
jgi:ferredoxin